MVRMTTEARRARAGSSIAPAHRPILRGAGLGSHPEVVFDARTAYDFFISLSVAAGEEADLLPEDATWLRRSRKSLAEPVRDCLDVCFGDESMDAFHALPSLLVARPDIKDARSFGAALDKIPDDGIVRLLVEDIVRHVEGPDLVERVIQGEEEALEVVQAKFEEWNKASIVTFLRDPRPSVDKMRQVVEAWLPLYQEVEDRVGSVLERDLKERKGDRASMDPATLIERTTGGLRWLPEPPVRRVIMAPSYFARPYNYIYQAGDWRLFAYPAADTALGSLDATVPPQAVVRLYRALGDATRMRILKLLTDRDRYLTELAQQLELSKPTMKHHLALLRAAGLVTVTEEGSLTYYSLRRERLDEAGVELGSFLA